MSTSPPLPPRMRRTARGFMLLGTLLLGLSSASALPLWEIRGARNQISVLGSIHVLRASDYPLHPAILAAFEKADVIYMELDMDDLDPIASASAIASLAVDPDGRELPEIVGPQTWRQASATAASLGLDLTMLTRFEPWYAAVVVTQLRLAQLGFDTTLGVEAQLSASASQAGKEVRGLETLEGQLAVLDALPAPAQRRFLETTLEEAADIDDEVDDMIRAWKTGDVRTLDRELLGSVRDQPELYRTIIVRRNADFARTIGSLRRDTQNYLVVIGALHLVGPDSVLAMLERQGLPSRQVTAP